MGNLSSEETFSLFKTIMFVNDERNVETKDKIESDISKLEEDSFLKKLAINLYEGDLSSEEINENFQKAIMLMAGTHIIMDYGIKKDGYTEYQNIEQQRDIQNYIASGKKGSTEHLNGKMYCLYREYKDSYNSKKIENERKDNPNVSTARHI